MLEYIKSVKSYMRNATCEMLHVKCYMPNATCKMLHAKCYMCNATCQILHAKCYMLHATCYMLECTCYNTVGHRTPDRSNLLCYRYFSLVDFNEALEMILLVWPVQYKLGLSCALRQRKWAYWSVRCILLGIEDYVSWALPLSNASVFDATVKY